MGKLTRAILYQKWRQSRRDGCFGLAVQLNVVIGKGREGGGGGGDTKAASNKRWITEGGGGWGEGVVVKTTRSCT